MSFRKIFPSQISYYFTLKSVRNSILSALINQTHPFHSTTTPNRALSEDFCLWILSTCNSKSLKEGVCVHSPIIKLGLQDNLLLNNNLLSVYSKCIGVQSARNLFDEMSQTDVVSWTGIVSAYVKSGEYTEAISLFDEMLGNGVVPNEFTFSSVLRSCSNLKDFDLGVQIQGGIIKLGFESNHVLESAMVDFYAKCGCVVKAFEIFKGMDCGDAVSWTTMISSFVGAKEWVQAMEMYVRMSNAGVAPNEFTFVKVLMACGFLGKVYAKLVHAHMILWGIRLNLVLKTALVDVYTKCQMMEEALKILNRTPEADVVLWTTLITGYTQNLDFEGALGVFRKMELSGFSPNAFTYAGLLHICSSLSELELGRQIHSRVMKVGLEWDLPVGNGLTDMYMKCSQTVNDALQAFNDLESPNVISWTSLISGFGQNGLECETFHAFGEMQAAGIQPNYITIAGSLKGCVTRGPPNNVRKLHAFSIKLKEDFNTIVSNSLIEAYARLGIVEDAWKIIKRMKHRDVITYTVLASGLNQTGHHEKTLGIISHMQDDNVKMDSFILASFLSASACLAAIEPGKQLHCYSKKTGLGSWISVSNGLVDLYGKCGSMQDAQSAFTEIRQPNVVSWNGLISGMASNSQFSFALSGFEDMRLAGIRPDEITFMLVLYACSHGGLVDNGIEYFYSMSKTYGIEPQLGHYICLVDLLGRAGRLKEALEVIEKMHFRPNALIFKTLLGSCKVHKNVALGEDMATRALELDPSDPAVYVLLANIYDDAGRSDLGDMTRRMMKTRGLKKNPGQSWMEVRNKVHLFTAGDQSHPQIKDLHEKIESLKVGLKIFEYECRENAKSYHSEKLAIAFGLLNTPKGGPIRIIKNLRICQDCHTFAKLVSQLTDREIVVRDGNRFHSFKNGDCSCQGYW
ncbi:hypothetical protein ACHQM5_024104 [Ranunculus cassubicifolius]